MLRGTMPAGGEHGVRRSRSQRSRHPRAHGVQAADGQGALGARGGPAPRRVVADARREGADDLDIHDTVLIAAAFCMFNRYVDGLRASTPDDPTAYTRMAELVVGRGYVR